VLWMLACGRGVGIGWEVLLANAVPAAVRRRRLERLYMLKIVILAALDERRVRTGSKWYMNERLEETLTARGEREKRQGPFFLRKELARQREQNERRIGRRVR
jgi:hypothetical protein